jgi:hypothetical protein
MASGQFNDFRIIGPWSPYFTRCRPRLLIVHDGLNYFSNDGFGLTQFIAAIAGAWPVPIITLAQRFGIGGTVTINGINYPVAGNFTFDNASPAVTLANYDQLWLFGVSQSPLSNAEIQTIANFMNGGGGVFATGDHGTLGLGMCGSLPRIRHMREWQLIPMGGEGNLTARDRIDTMVDPGASGEFEFDDQSDDIPQRIYPNYDADYINFAWTASLHPLLRMPGAPATRAGSQDFMLDIDILPDHPHESVCYEVSLQSKPAELNAAFNIAGMNFVEFPGLFGGGAKVGSRIVAFAVSGGRAIGNPTIYKPPVNPRMFGVISAFDGHSAALYAGAATRPGRIVCDSTWHHFININLDGTGSSRFGLSLPHLQKIYQYYRNIIDWIQPANRRRCWWYWDLVTAVKHPFLAEEVIEIEKFRDPEDVARLGLQAIDVLDQVRGRGGTADLVMSILRGQDDSAGFADNPESRVLTGDEADGRGVLSFIVGSAVAHVARSLPLDRPDLLEARLKGDEHEKDEAALAAATAEALPGALALQQSRLEQRLGALSRLAERRFAASDAKEGDEPEGSY